MERRTIYITAYDLDRLSNMLSETDDSGRKDLADLENELDRAQVVDPKDVPGSVVTMNSQVRLRDLDTGEDELLTLVFPQHANLEQGKMSVMSPIGTAILGYAVGDEIQWKVPAGMRRLRIDEILYQPEAAGDLDA